MCGWWVWSFHESSVPVVYSLLYPPTHPPTSRNHLALTQKKKYEKLGYNTKKGGEREQM